LGYEFHRPMNCLLIHLNDLLGSTEPDARLHDFKGCSRP
jgi:hypothetical protein